MLNILFDCRADTFESWTSLVSTFTKGRACTKQSGALGVELFKVLLRFGIAGLLNHSASSTSRRKSFTGMLKASFWKAASWAKTASFTLLQSASKESLTAQLMTSWKSYLKILRPLRRHQRSWKTET